MRIVSQEYDCKDEHQNGADDPVLNQGQSQNLPILEDVP